MEMRFDHVAQQVPDIAAAINWYQQLIPGCRVLYQDESWGFVDACGVRLAFVKKDQHPGHIGWRVSEAELEVLAERHGQEIRPHRDGTKSFYLEAPGGQWVEIIAFPPDAAY